MLVDPAAHKEAEEALRLLNETLEKRVEERTRQLSDALTQLRESERRFRLFVDGVTDYAIFMLDTKASSPTGIREQSGSKAIRLKRSLVSISPCFTRLRIDKTGCRSAH